jgi:hypothetical protein
VPLRPGQFCPTLFIHTHNPNNRKIHAPNLRCRPLFVSGMPIVRETLDLKAETPRNLQMEKPPRFIVSLHLPTQIRRVLQNPSSLLCRCCDSNQSSPAAVREFTRSHASGTLRGVTVLGTGYNEQAEEVWVKVGFSRATMANRPLGVSNAELNATRQRYLQLNRFPTHQEAIKTGVPELLVLTRNLPKTRDAEISSGSSLSSKQFA